MSICTVAWLALLLLWRGPLCLSSRAPREWERKTSWQFDPGCGVASLWHGSQVTALCSLLGVRLES